ncbi:SDR family oxidoreductase [Amycolatopsis pithecellobii]|uniref:SDR family oxidoreductase n=1 Tax=Amycolatopsis pithecellobii TaxID=664692 RepID=A0A6N7YW04_9PSEU|nr:SDR family oxidoreductase [Amycolatopsis pithecellobii]MTD53053.1 SDR family oxidoreductase [Amycolatopsis pithecellobii]
MLDVRRGVGSHGAHVCAQPLERLGIRAGQGLLDLFADVGAVALEHPQEQLVFVAEGAVQAALAEGAYVFITGRRQAELDAAVRELGPNGEGIRTDSSDLADLDALYRTIQQRKARIDVLVANAGGGVAGPLAEVTEEAFDKTFDTNVKGVLFTVQNALPLLTEDASVILTGSTTSLRPGPGLGVYSATKAAIRNLARSWIIELGASGVRVNVLSPGPTNTPGLLGLAPAGQEQALLDAQAAEVPLDRVADPAEIANAAIFLATDQSSFVNGVEFFVDGGQAQI